MVQSKGRHQEPTAPTAAQLIGCGGRAAAAAAAVGNTTTSFFCLFSGRNNSLCVDRAASREIYSRVRGGTVGSDDNVRNHPLAV